MFGKAKALKNKIIDKTSDVLSAPTRAYYDSKSRQYNREAQILRDARQMGRKRGTVTNGKPDEVMATKSAADSIRMRRNNQYK